MRSTTTTLQLPVVSVQSLLDTAGSALAAPPPAPRRRGHAVVPGGAVPA
ncbi:MAG: hypothetical protein KA181_06620 [Xylophilus sp.]|nr:hypothetical protein [Xylophilus sp.]